MKQSNQTSRREFFKGSIRSGFALMWIWLSGCVRKEEPEVEPKPTNTPAPPTEMPEEKVEPSPTSTPTEEPFRIDLTKVGNLLIICGVDIELDGDVTILEVELFEGWIEPSVYYDQQLVLGKVKGEGISSRLYEDRQVLDTNNLSGNETCVIGFEYDDQFLGVQIPFSILTQDYPIRERFNGIAKFLGEEYRFNTFYYIPPQNNQGGSLDESGGGGPSVGQVVGSFIGG